MGFGVFLQEIAEQVVVGVDVRVLLQPLGPVGLEGRLGLDVRNTAHSSVYAKAKILAVSYTHLDVYKRQGVYLFSNRFTASSGSGQVPFVKGLTL